MMMRLSMEQEVNAINKEVNIKELLPSCKCEKYNI